MRALVFPDKEGGLAWKVALEDAAEMEEVLVQQERELKEKMRRCLNEMFKDDEEFLALVDAAVLRMKFHALCCPDRPGDAESFYKDCASKRMTDFCDAIRATNEVRFKKECALAAQEIYRNARAQREKLKALAQVSLQVLESQQGRETLQQYVTTMLDPATTSVDKITELLQEFIEPVIDAFAESAHSGAKVVKGQFRDDNRKGEFMGEPFENCMATLNSGLKSDKTDGKLLNLLLVRLRDEMAYKFVTFVIDEYDSNVWIEAEAQEWFNKLTKQTNPESRFADYLEVLRCEVMQVLRHFLNRYRTIFKSLNSVNIREFVLASGVQVTFWSRRGSHALCHRSSKNFDSRWKRSIHAAAM